MMRVNERATSKSARKREHLALQALGEELIGLPRADLEAMDLDPALLEAIVVAGALRSRSASRRQRQLIGKLMRHADAERIRAELEARGRGGQEANAAFHAAERWRDRLCDGGADALAAFAARTGGDGRALEILLAELDRATDEPAVRRVRRRLFREIHARLRDTKEKGEGA